jgi:hypothetical protein
VDVAGETIHATLSAVYGHAMYRSPVTGKTYAIVNSEEGEVEQWELFDNGSGRVEGSLVRSIDVGSHTEGCVADEERGDLYIGEEDVAIWKYGAEPGDGSARQEVDHVGSRLTADIEGLTLYYTGDGTGYLLASSQGSNEFVIYRREGSNDYIGTFKIVSGGGIDGVTDTDGIDVTNVALGSSFPSGVFVAQDGSQSGANQNFKLVPWEVIAQAMTPPLTIDTSWNPRELDQDGDGYPTPEDCDDQDPDVHPGAAEQCDGVDDDCDGMVDGPDSEDDGVGAACDNCPTVANAGQEDDDKNGVGDACDLAVLSPGSGQSLDCRTGAEPPTISWSPTIYDRLKVTVAGSPDMRGKPRITGSRSQLIGSSWRIPPAKWQKLCARAGATVYVQVKGVDLDTSKKAPRHVHTSPIVEASLQH